MTVVLQVMIRGLPGPVGLFLAEDQAKHILSKWVSREYHTRGVKVLEGSTAEGPYAIQIDDIVGMLINHVPQQQQSLPQRRGHHLLPGTSGVG